MLRVLATPAGRVVQASPGSGAVLGGGASAVQDGVDDVLAIAAQRWPGQGMGSAARDLFLPADAGGSVWARLTRWSSADGGSPGAVSVAFRLIRVFAPPGVGLVDDPRIAGALRILADEFASPLSLHQLAERCGVSAFHFHRLFVAAVGVSPKHMLLRVQLVHARHRLRTTGDTIGEIASGCGFARQGHFSTTFRRRIGVSPRRFRQGQDALNAGQTDKHGGCGPASA